MVAQTMSAIFLIASLYVVGSVLHHWVEVPGRNIVRRLGDRTGEWLRQRSRPRALSRG
jgi:hypothetical protein